MKPCTLTCGLILTLVGLLLAGDWLTAQDSQKTDGDALTEKHRQLQAKFNRLGGVLHSLKQQGLRDPWLADIEIYYQAVARAVQHEELTTPASLDAALEALNRGLLRATLASEGDSPWLNTSGSTVVRAYRSQVDGSVQPYAVTFPAQYANRPKKWRIDVVLHGRDNSLNEVKFLRQHNGEKPAPAADFVRLDLFGRGNNAYRWAGEKDVLEALHNFALVEQGLRRGMLLDQDRMVLRGFSMGGAGTWHIGLHMPDRWCVLGPGAGFTTTHGYIGDLPDPLPEYQEKCLRIYDAVDYAENAFDVPVVAYAGSKDRQLQAAQNIQARLKKLGLAEHMKLLIAPDLGHAFPPAWQKKAEEEYARYAERGRPEYPEKIRFVTYTLKYPSCDWVEILSLEEHYRRSLVEAEKTPNGFSVKTTNIRSLHLSAPSSEAATLDVDIDGQKLQVRPWVGPNAEFHVYLRKLQGRWKALLPQILRAERVRLLRKITGLQGPIDDAFTENFLCVRGTGKAWHEKTQQYAEARLQQFQQEWSKWWRGDLPIKDDVDVKDSDISSRHLILFGDPSSNSILGQVLEQLPLQWTKDEIQMAGKTVKSGEHVPVLIYPSPLNPQHYIVLNSGHTFHEADYRGTNALLYPRWGDYALLRLAPQENDPLAVDVVTAGLFDDAWQVPTPKEGSAQPPR